MRPPRVFYFCHDHNRPTGGQKETYQHVDILTQNGFQAYAFHRKPAFRLTWFDNDTPIVDAKAFEALFDPTCDYLVLPEDLGTVALIPGRKVIFNKNVHHGFGALGENVPIQYPALASDVVAIFTVSEHNLKRLQFAYPSVSILRVDVDIRTEVFKYSPVSAKEPVIASIQKHPAHVYSVYHMIQTRACLNLNAAHKFKWVFLKDLSESQVAQILQKSLLFVFLSTDEGFPRMPLEAMASGCIVLSYDDGPQSEYLPRAYQFQHGDFISIVQFIETVMRLFPDHISEYHTTVELARKTAERYSAQRQEQSVLNAWEKVFKCG